MRPLRGICGLNTMVDRQADRASMSLAQFAELVALSPQIQ